MPTKKLYPCMLCEKRYAEIEDAEVCERSHEASAAQESWRPGSDDDPAIIAHKRGDRE